MSVILSVIWVAALKFKPLRIKLSRHWVPRYCFHKTFLRALNKDVVICHTLALDYDIDQLGN